MSTFEPGFSDLRVLYGRITKILPWIQSISGIESQFNPASADMDCSNEYPADHPDAQNGISEEEAEAAQHKDAIPFPPPVPGMIQRFNVSANKDCYYRFEISSLEHLFHNF